MTADVARFLLERTADELDRLAADPAAPDDRAARAVRHARGRHEVARTWLRLAATGDELLAPRLAELGRVLCLLAAAYEDHPDFPALAERSPLLRSGFPLW